MQRACDQDDGAGARVAAISRAEAAGGHRARSLPHCVSRTVAQVEVGDGVQRGAAAALAQQVARRQAHHRRAHAGLHLDVVTSCRCCTLN